MKLKEIIISTAIALTAIFVLPTGLNAAPPPWAPAHGYDKKTTHIFLPDQNMYYDLSTSEYIYEENGQWFKTLYIPEKFSHVDFRNANQLEVQMKRNNEPYTKLVEHRETYNKQVREAQNAYIKEQKQILEEAEREQKEAEKARKEVEKVTREFEKAAKENEKAQKKQAKAEAKALKQKEAAEKKAKKEADKAKKALEKAEKARIKAEKEQKKADKKAEKIQKDIEKANKRAEKARIKAEKAQSKAIKKYGVSSGTPQ